MMGYVGAVGLGGSWQSVHHPDSLMEEAVFQSAGPSSEALQSPPRWRVVYVLE